MENASCVFLDSVRKSMRQICKTLGVTRVYPRLLTAAERLQYEGYLRREQTNAAIMALAKDGVTIKEIVRRTGHSRGLVHQVLRGHRHDVFRSRESSLEPYLEWLDAQWTAGKRNGTELWQRLRTQGFRGSRRVVSEWATRRKRADKADAESLTRIPSARTIARLLTDNQQRQPDEIRDRRHRRDRKRRSLARYGSQYHRRLPPYDPAQIGKRARIVDRPRSRKSGCLLWQGRCERHTERGGESLVRTAVQQIESESRDLQRMVRDLAGHLDSASDRKIQDRYLWIVGATGGVVGILATLFLPMLLPFSAAPHVASIVMADSPWRAGMSLMAFDSPEGWDRVASADKLIEANKAEVAACRGTAAKTRNDQKCMISVPAPGQ
jgi:hypothetical protein